MPKIIEVGDGTWNVVDDNGEVLATETTNSAAWRALERLEVRVRGRKSFLYQTDGSLTVRRK